MACIGLQTMNVELQLEGSWKEWERVEEKGCKDERHDFIGDYFLAKNY